MSKLAEFDTPSFCFKKGSRFFGVFGSSRFDVFLGEPVPQGFPFAPLRLRWGQSSSALALLSPSWFLGEKKRPEVHTSPQAEELQIEDF